MHSKSKSSYRLSVTGTICVSLLYFGFAFAPRVAHAQFGRIVGQVMEAESGAVLPGANIAIKNTTLGAATGNDGRYRISRVPVGSYTLEITYLGYESQTAEAQVNSNESTTANFSMKESVLYGEEVVVLGIRAKNQARALNQQFNAANIKNVVASDQIGRFPDASAPEALQRIPGIHIVRDQGEGRYVQIRGGSAAMTSVTFNGERVPSPEGDVRQIALDAVPTEVLESIEVSKAITPDMDADAIGGSVNLVTKRAPEGGMLNFEMGPGYGSIRKEAAGKGTFTWGDRTRNGKLGLLVSGSLAKRSFGSDDLEPEFNFNEIGLADDELEELQVRHYTLTRERRGVTSMLDYRLNANSNLYLNGIWTEMRDNEIRRRLRHRVGDDELEYNHKDRFEILSSWNFTGGGEHLFRNDVKFDYHMTVTRSEEDTPRDDEIIFVQGDVTFSPDLSNPKEPEANPAAGTIDGVYTFDAIEPAISQTTNRDYVVAANLEIPYGLGSRSTGKLKFGSKFRHKKKDQDVSESASQLVDGASDIILGQDIGQPFSNAGYNPGSYPYPSRVPTKSEVRDFMDRYGSSLESEINLEGDVEDFEAEEQTFALYGMTEINFSAKFMLLAGARFERTSLDNKGFEFDTATETITPTTGSSSYSRVFPMIHARYRITPETNLRAAVTSALLRPNFFDLAPFRLRDDEDITFGNPDLSPATSINLDLLFEHYMRPLGILTAGVFHRRINDPVFRFTERNSQGGDSVQPQNGQNGWVTGAEIALQQQLKFLPKPLDGLGIYTNYTRTASESTLPDGRKADFAGQAENVFNAALSYEKGPFSGQVSLNYNDKFVEEFGGDIGGGLSSSFTDIFVDEHLQLDVSANVRVSKTISIFFQWVNLTNEPWVLYQTDKSRPIQREFYESWMWAGFNITR